MIVSIGIELAARETETAAETEGRRSPQATCDTRRGRVE